MVLQTKMVDFDNEWQFAYILPNLSIKQAIGNEYVAISPSNDQRIQNTIQKYPIIYQFVNSLVLDLLNIFLR